MADISMTPVGNTIIPPNPMTGINSLSGILGVQQQQQNLQTGAYRQSQEQATSQQAQQQNAELQALARFTKNAAQDSSYLNDDGSANVGKYQTDAMKVAPVYGQQYIGQMTNNFNGAVENRKALLGLSNEQRATIANYFAPVTDSASFDRAVEQARGVSDDPAYQRTVNRLLKSMPNTQGMTDQQSSAAYQEAAKRIAVSTQAPSMAQVLPQATNTGAGIVNRGPIRGEITAPPGAAPGSALNPTPPQVAGATARQVQTGNADIDRANQVGDMQQQASSTVSLSKEIDRLADDINSGRVAKMISETGNYFGLSSMNQVRSQLNKDLGLVKGVAIAKVGSDPRAGTILEGYPTDTTPTETIHAAMDYIRGTARQNLARGAVLSQYQKADPQGLRGFQAADNILTGQTNPLMHEFLALKPEERAGFYKRNFGNAQEAQAFKNQVTALQKHTSVLGP